MSKEQLKVLRHSKVVLPGGTAPKCLGPTTEEGNHRQVSILSLGGERPERFCCPVPNQAYVDRERTVMPSPWHTTLLLSMLLPCQQRLVQKERERLDAASVGARTDA